MLNEEVEMGKTAKEILELKRNEGRKEREKRRVNREELVEIE